MNHRLMTGLALVSLFVGCGGGGSGSGTGGASPTGSGGSVTGSGGSTGTGGAAPGSGGAPSGSGGSTTGTGGGSSGGTGPATGGNGPGTGGRGGTGTGGAVNGGAGGRSATGGAPATGGAGGTAPSTGSVLERNNNPARDGHFLQPMLTKARAATMARDTGFTGTFSGAMWASPLYLENGPGGKGIFIAVTTGNDVVALDETTGAVTWMKSIGTPSTSGATSGGQCFAGSIINPLGILSTPVIDPVTKTIYVAGATGSASGITAHIATALSTDDGTVKSGWPVDVSAYAAFDPKIHNQRSALSLVGGILYVAYGGFVGDCGQYRGRVVAINAATPTMRGNWATGGIGEGIWPPGGMASDGNGVFVVTGNNTNNSSTHLDSEEVIRLTGLAVSGGGNTNVFYPASWRTMDSQDADFSANNPVYIEVPGATPSKMVVALAKDGHMYILDAANLGGMGGQKVDFMVSSGAMSLRSTPAAYMTAMGMHLTFSTDSGAMCPAGMPSGKVVMSVLIPAGSPPAPKVVWCAALGGQVTAPIATTSNGSSDAIVWFMNNNRLMGVDGDTGAVVANPTDTCMGVRKWTSPIAAKGRIIAGADGRLCSWSPH